MGWAMAKAFSNSDIVPVSSHVLALRQALAGSHGKRIATFRTGQLDVEIRAAADSVWALIRRDGKGGLALRAAHVPGAFQCRQAEAQAGEVLRLIVDSAIGRHVIAYSAESDALECLRMTVRLTPATPLLMPFTPRDLYPLDARDDPLGARGNVEAAQRGLNSGVLYFRLDEPGFGNVLYFQNLTAMNDYYRATKTKPDGAVGGEWPELGYLMPSPPQSGKPPTDPLTAGVEVTLSDAILVFRHDAPAHERESARHFLQMLGVAYKRLDLPGTDYRDWIDRAERTLHDLDTAPEATITHYGHRYIHPYTAAEYPDIMVQMSVIAAVHAWGKWSGEPHPLEAEFKAGSANSTTPSSSPCAVICRMSARTRMPMPSIAGISITRCSISASWRWAGTRMRASCS